MTSDKQIKAGIKAQLEHWGLIANPLPEEHGKKTPDFLATSNDEQYLIEVKEKIDPDREDEKQRLAQGELVARAEPWGKRNTISGIVKDGVEQLDAYPCDQSTLRLLWLIASGKDPDLYWNQFSGTVYGTTQAYELGGQGRSWTCYYRHDSSFFRWRLGLDGVIISQGVQAQLCLNTYSARVSALRSSRLAACFAGDVLDPLALEQEGSALIADCDTDRRDSGGIQRYLQEKYGVMVDFIERGKITAQIQLPLDQPD